MESEPKVKALRVWDGPTRLFHWTLVALLVFSWWSAENRMMDWHRITGSTVVGLVIFRLLWGLFGSSTARFAHFVRGPSASLSYLRGGEDYADRPGHNPLGGYSVLLLLLMLVVQVASGLLATDVDGLESGPLSYLVSFEAGRQAAQVHEISFNVLLAASALHVLAIVFYLLVKRRNLVTAMFTGSSKHYRSAEGELVPAGWLRLILAIAIAAAAAWYLFNGLSFAPVESY